MAKFNSEKYKAEHKIALKRFKIVEDAEKEQRELAIEDARFAHTEDGQWDDEAKEKRADRPRYTINRIAGSLDQLTGDQRQNQTQIKVLPRDGQATEELAELKAGLIRDIENNSRAKNAYDNAYDEVITTGYGGWRVLAVENDDDIFVQDLCIKPIKSAASSLWFDTSAIEYDKRDANWAFLTSNMQKDEFNDKYPDASENEFEQEKFSKDKYCANWVQGDTIRVAEYWYKEPVMRRIGLLSDGRSIDLVEEAAVLDELKAQGVEVIKEREVKSHVVKMVKMSGAEFLEEPKEIASKYIGLVPVYGKTFTIESKEYVRGLVRFAKDPSKVYNYATSASIEAAALTPKDPIWITPTQAAGHEQALKKFNVSNTPFMLYNPDSDAPGPPARTGAPSVQTALLSQVAQAKEDLMATMGMFAASLGDGPQLLSEKSLKSQAAMGDRGAYIFQDNLEKSESYCGEILNDMLPRIYDTERTVRVLGIDGSINLETINKPGLDALNQPIIDEQTGKQVIVNDLTQGKYGVTAKSGPAFNTMREESANQLIELAKASPMFEQLATDLIAKNLNLLESEELTKRVRTQMIKQGIVEPTPEEVEELGLGQEQQDPANEALVENVNVQTEKLITEIENIEADTQDKRIETQERTLKAYERLISAYEKQINLGIPLTPKDIDNLNKQKDIITDGQEVIDPGPNSEQAADLAQMLQNQGITEQ